MDKQVVDLLMSMSIRFQTNRQQPNVLSISVF
jgi:hypothetical protein